MGEVTGIEGQSGKDMCQGGGKPDTGKFHSSYMYVAPPMRMARCVVDGTCATAAEWLYEVTNSFFVIPYMK